MGVELRLAYFVSIKEGASYIGGLLITNSLGIPTDFRYTEPITPTKLQSILYGKALEPHLKGEVIQNALLKEIKSPPDLMFMQASDLVAGFAAETNFPTLSAQHTQELPMDALGALSRITPRELLVQIAENGHPLKILFGHGVGEAAQEAAIKNVLDASYQMDVVEPMERVLGALRTLIRHE
jgi:hypothetical protein